MHTTIRACFLCFFYNPYMSLFNSKNFSFTYNGMGLGTSIHLRGFKGHHSQYCTRARRRAACRSMLQRWQQAGFGVRRWEWGGHCDPTWGMSTYCAVSRSPLYSTSSLLPRRMTPSRILPRPKPGNEANCGSNNYRLLWPLSANVRKTLTQNSYREGPDLEYEPFKTSTTCS